MTIVCPDPLECESGDDDYIYYEITAGPEPCMWIERQCTLVCVNYNCLPLWYTRLTSFPFLRLTIVVSPCTKALFSSNTMTNTIKPLQHSTTTGQEVKQLQFSPASRWQVDDNKISSLPASMKRERESGYARVIDQANSPWPKWRQDTSEAAAMSPKQRGNSGLATAIRWPGSGNSDLQVDDNKI